MRTPCAHRFWAWMMCLMALILCGSGARAANIAAGKPAFATINNATAGSVTDSNQGTAWTAAGSPSGGLDVIGVDLGAASPIKTVRIYWGATLPTMFTVDAATTAVTDPADPNFGQGNWVTLTTYSGGQNGTTPPANPYVVDYSAQSHNYRYVRINVTGAPSDQWGVAEFQVLDAPLPKITGTALYNGAGVANAFITLSGPSGTSVVKTSASGAFSFAGLDPGAYTLTARAPGRYAPVVASVNVGTVDVAQNITFSASVVNSTAPLPAYNLDFIASATAPRDMNAAVDPLALQAELLPALGATWTTSTPPPAGAEAGPDLPPTLQFFMPPAANQTNNVLNAINVTIPFAPANYSAVYVLQTALEGNFYTTATLRYADGTSELATTSSGSTLYGFSRGDNGANAGAPGEDEIVALTFQEMYGGEDFTELRPWNLFVRQVNVNPAKVLTAIEFNGSMDGPGSNTLAKGLILGWSADSLAAPGATGSISGTIKAPGGAPVSGAIVNLGSFRIVTNATGTYTFKGLPAGEWTVSARKPAFYAPTTRVVTLTAGQNATGQDIQFSTPAPILAAGIGAPQVDLISSDANYGDFSWTGWMPGREYFPTGLYNPTMGGSPGIFDAVSGAPENLAFYFHDYGDTPIPPGTAGYPEGGTPSAQVLAGSTFLAPPVKTTAAYFAIIGAEGSNNVVPTLVYTDGTSETRRLAIGDWFQAPTPDEFPYISMHGRHSRTGESNASPDTNIRLNSLIVSVNPNKTLKYIQFGQHSNVNAYPMVLAVSWETDTPQPATSDVVVNVKKADNSPAARAIVTLGPYNTYTDDQGNARFYAIPANLSVGIGAYISGVTKQARVENNVIPSGRTVAGGNPHIINVTLPAVAPIFVQLPLAVDHDALAMPDMPGDYKTGRHNDRGFMGETFPASLTTATVASVPYRMPIKETFYNNILRVNGQSLKVVPGKYSSLDILITGPGIGGNTRITYVDLKYSDGTSELVQYGVMDWVKDWANVAASNRELFWRMINLGSANPFYSPGRRGPANDDTAQVSFPAQIIPINASKTLVSIELLPMLGGIEAHDFEILAATLEANEVTGASSTITGTVVGKPMGAAAAGPLGLTQVILDDAHAAYTDANGNFTIPNAPVGAGSLKVIPYGTGIVSKSFPVNVIAGTTNAGTLNVGNAVTQVSVTLGETDIENGVRLQKPTVFPSSRVNVGEARTVPVTVAGKSGRESVFGRYYFNVDDGWLWRGMQGNNGLTIVDRGLPTQDLTKLAPTIYVQIEYFDKGTDTFGFEMNRMEEWTYQQTTGGPTLQTTRLTNMWHNPGQEVTKTDTGTWKTVVLTLDPAVNNNAFGAYNGQHLIADFLIDDRDGTEIIHKVTFSTTPDFVVPSIAADILRAAGGLAAVTAGNLSALDADGNGVVDLKDAVKAAREAQGL